jgi:hypothetical protein
MNTMKITRDALFQAVGGINGASPSRGRTRRHPASYTGPAFESPQSLGQLPELFRGSPTREQS